MKSDKIIDPLGSDQLADLLAKNFNESPLIPGEYSLAIKDSEKLSLFFSIVHQSANAMVITNVKKDIIYVNKKFEKLSGYKMHEVLGKNPRVLKSGKTPVDTYRDMRRTLEMGHSWKGVFFNEHRDGEEYIEEAVISPVVCDSGEVICYVAEKRDITFERNSEEQAWKLARFDSLTSLPNRANFIEQLSKLVDTQPTKDNCFSVLFVDLDRFKELNDSSGHLAGDVALQETSKRIEQVLPPSDFVARVGGDEFVVIHQRATEESTRQLGLELVAAIRRPIPISEGQEAILGVSIGSSSWPQDGITVNHILSRADLAMYEVKSMGGGYLTYGKQISTRFYRDQELLRKLKKAINNGSQFHLKYQPKYYLASNKIAGVEALIRWDDPILGSISPAEFIPIAEKNKMMRPIGQWVVKTVCLEVRRWQSKGWTVPGRVAVNVSVQQLEHPNFFEEVTSIVMNEGLSPKLFELEVTESVLISNPEKTMIVLKKLEEVGFSISIDDFGTGFSSLSYLKRINANILKIDKSFVDGLPTNLHDKTIVTSIVNLAHNLGLSVVAEGVENEDQKQCLADMGCDMVQGYYYSKPVTADELFRNVRTCE
ncbi:EAL domain-containing protein [Vibrio harveyi]|uniref:EAL domain-containing protein n=1 Tax=Vibrio harveyi TaxID=669 RepID=UPI001EFC68DC|nr:GGDEF domain-containing phosphodiesterase [Vibrio harveyi]MCG9610821.1 EAL domain-containing protein [Vibrio harveyi]MCG9669225.1 EAL domain-containing protein [Vibrio harveyi]